MNPNIPHGQPMPMYGQPPQRRHDNPYAQMRPPYPQYYPQPMAPMMPQYSQQQYPQNWYPYQHHIHPHHAGQPQYYQRPPIPAPHIPQHHAHMYIPSPQPSHHSPRHVSIPTNPYPVPLPSSTASTTSIPQARTPPSRPTSIVSAVNNSKDYTPPVTPLETSTQLVETPAKEPSAAPSPFVPPLPWLSVHDQPFPTRAPRVRRKVPRSTLGTEPVTFPIPDLSEPVVETEETGMKPETPQQQLSIEEIQVPTPTQTPTPLPSDAVSDTASTQPTTPLSTAPMVATKAQTTTSQPKAVRAAVPVVPVLPVLPQSSTTRVHRDSVASRDSNLNSVNDLTSTPAEQLSAETTDQNIQSDPSAIASPQPAIPPSSWAALLRSKNPVTGSTVDINSVTAVNGLGVLKSETLGDVLNEIGVSEAPSKVAFLQPRGLINTGNMCYMNSILQMLVFCIPFYEFLDRVANRAPHTFKSDTPLVDAMIMFMREYPTIDSTSSVEQLRLRLKPEDYERYGDSFIPEYVYNVIKELPRFRDMRRGHQQDAQEFLGFLLEELHEECAHAMRTGTSASSGRSTPVNNAPSVLAVSSNDGGWMEVGAKQKSAITRSSGAITTESPVTNIFGGKLRSELKVSGNKLSVTLEPYQPLQLDIGSHQINNIVDALKGLTKPESMQGDFQSARGTKNTATKQVFIETLPPVLILHLKRFHYDASTKRVEKIWKKVGYPLELELPKEVFPTSVRNKYAAHTGLPKYRLIGVIYHHGKNANGGHYTVDIRRQDGREWIRIDDTYIRRIRSDDVAEGGSEEDPKVLAAALEKHKQGKASGNRFDQIEDDEEEEGPEKVWSQVNGHSRSKSTMSAVLNGTATPAKDSSGPQTPRDRYSVKDNKVAYLLFYQRVKS